MVSSRLFATAALMSLLAGCTWVKMAPGASAVRVYSSAPSQCEKRAEVEVSVKQNLYVYYRNAVKVREELETLARNEAPGLGGNAISPVNEPTGGVQNWAVWRCPGN
ncbi:MAG: DUF4156 domain-containing protein [Pseudoxanthomonas suwonensis]|nr:DUF4156 domain-containing protein [Pseudoxanthomonas suwonensis]